jgi:hypothetical protein
MDHAIPKNLRKASQRKGAAIRKKDPLEFEEFLKEWRLRLRVKGERWGGPCAVAELQRKKMFNFLLCKKRSEIYWQAEDLLSRIVDEMKAYRKEASGRLVKEHYDDIDEFLKKDSIRIKRQEERTTIQELKSLLKYLRKKVERTRKTARRLKKGKKDWPFGVWRLLWPEIPRKNLVSRKIELDTRLQVELGKMFADYLRPEGVKLETIARLILLAYLVGGLSGMDGKVIRTIYTDRVLKVRNIRENLRDAGLHLANSFQVQT